MARTPTPEEAIERAQRAQESRIESVRALAVARQNVTDAREDADRQRAELEARLTQQIGDAERADVSAYSAATSAGWSADELRKIGFPEPVKVKRVTRRRRAASAAAPVVDDSSSTPESEAQNSHV